ncbi:uncharacterized protein involved in outer membrane biogenesis [Inhella inkyongensis]|uniref:Uncharacterized protein involved in outer membrane biogenesis n=1 Tax=Inhella inkyongensis TaxID=392593 RepID=A0A840S6V9_9BURK|nr:DUF748 domain-containing protein [Inhella inkyongensis]MBB5204200.1 uncharacterized protein involved in outer membrane biogenesis [Inhella inkyongensis]
MKLTANRTARRWALGLMAFLLGLVCVLAALPWALQPWLKAQLKAQMEQALGRTVGVEAVDLSLLRGRVAVQGLVVAARGDQGEPLFTLEGVELALAPSSLWRRMPVLRELSVRGPQLNLRRESDGRTSVDDVLARLKSGPERTGPALAWALYNLSLSGGRVQLQQADGPRLVLDHLTLGLPFLSTHQDDVEVHVQPRLSGRWQGREFAAEVQSRPFLATPEAGLSLNWQGFELAQLDPWLPQSLGLRLQGGQIDGALRLRFLMPPKAAPYLGLSGRLKVEGLGLSLAQGPLRSVQGAGLDLDLLASEPLKQQFQLRSLTLSAEQASLKPAGMKGLKLVALEGGVTDLQWPLAGPVHAASKPAKTASWKLQARWADESGRALAQTDAQGALLTEELQAQWQLAALDLAVAQAWHGAGRPWGLAGQVAAQGQVRLTQPLQPGPGERLQVEVEQLSAQGLQLRHGDDLQWQNGEVQLAGLVWGGQRELRAQSLSLKGAALRLRRDADGLWSSGASGGATAEPSPQAAPWRLGLDEFKLALGRIEWQDTLSRPLQDAGQVQRTTLWQGRDLQLQSGPLRWEGDRLTSASLQLGLRSGPQRNPALLQWRGQVSSLGTAQSPWADGRLSLRRWPLAVLDSYLPPHLGLGLRDALVGAELSLRADAQALQLRGAADLQSLDLVSVREEASQRWVDQGLLAWQRLGALGLDVRWPLLAGERAQFHAEEVALQGLQAQLLIDAQGQLRLRGQVDAQTSPAPSSAQPAEASPAPRIRVGRVRLENAAVDFEDRFVKPSYRAQLGRLSGELGRFDSEQRQRAPLRLSGSVAGTGVLNVEGELHPALQPPQLDLRAQASDIELALFSPYSGKYLGYAIERGKLSSQLHYRLGPEGQLQADNRVVLNQLTLGERVDSPEATSLPVRLALALLSDREGVIDINLPIEGSLQDPQFRIGALVWKLIGNLIVKVVSSPFAWMSGGGEQGAAGRLVFAPGTTQWSLALGAEQGGASQQLTQMVQLAEGLKQKPALLLTLTSWYDPELEAPALARERVEAALRQAWARERGQADQAASLKLPDSERARLLRALYTSRPLPDRPRNLLGLLKTLPEGEMLARLQAAEKVTQDDVRELALARAAAVRDALVAQGLPLQRLFLAAPKVRPEAEAKADWQPHVELGLSLP